MIHAEQPSECSCDFTRLPGHWGGGMYHYFRETEETFVKREMDRYYLGKVGNPNHSAVEDQREEAESRARSTHYAGQPVAYEMCPRAKERIDRQIAEKPNAPREEERSWSR